MEHKINIANLKNRLLEKAQPKPGESSGMSEGEQYLYQVFARPLLNGMEPNMDSLDLSRFSLEDMDKLYDKLCRSYCQRFNKIESIYTHLKRKGPYKVRQSYL